MARHVQGNISQYLNVDTGTSIPYPVSISYRFKAVSTATGPVSVCYGEAYPAWDGKYSQLASTSISASEAQGGIFLAAAVNPTVVNGQWYLVVMVYSNNGNRRVYVDSSAFTAVETTVVGYVDHASRNLTLGTLLTAVGVNHTGLGFDGDIADVAIWDTALTATDVDALAAGRPGDVKPANLKAWYKLGADGDLTSSVGTYPAMSVVGTVPVTADPPYAGGTPGTIKTINAVPVAGIKTYDSIPLASVKTINALTVGSGSAFEPDDLTGLGAWWRADYGAGSYYTAQFVTANSESLSAPSSTSLQLGDIDFTIGMWYRQDAALSYQILMSKRDTSLSNVEYLLYINNGTTQPLFQAGTPLLSGPTGLAVATWRFIVAWHDAAANTLNMQVDNGTVISVSTGGAAPPAGSESFRLGAQGAAVSELFFGGRIQNPFVFGRILTATERTFLYNSGAGRTFIELDAAFKTNIRAWWPLDELSGSRRDVSLNNNTLTDNNTVLTDLGVVINHPAPNNGGVFRWADSGPNLLHLDASIGAPTYFTNGKNGQPVLYFPYAMSTRLIRATPFVGSLLSGTNAGTIFVVLYNTQSPPTNNALYGWLNPSPTNHIALYPTYTGYFDWDMGSAVPATGRIHVAAPAPWGDTWHILELCRNGTAGEILYEGTVVATGTFSDDLENTGAATFGVGWDNSGTFFNGYLGELIFYNRTLSSTERTSVRNYLKAKWGFA